MREFSGLSQNDARFPPPSPSSLPPVKPANALNMPNYHRFEKNFSFSRLETALDLEEGSSFSIFLKILPKIMENMLNFIVLASFFRCFRLLTNVFICKNKMDYDFLIATICAIFFSTSVIDTYSTLKKPQMKILRLKVFFLPTRSVCDSVNNEIILPA